MPLVVGENTYISLADAEEYFATRYNSTIWDALTDPDKEILLQSATRALDLYCLWAGYKTDPDQLLEFPRDDEDTPKKVELAECEICLSILENDSVIDETEPNLTKLKADVIEFHFGKVGSTSSLYNNFTSSLLTGFCSGGLAGGTLVVRR